MDLQLNLFLPRMNKYNAPKLGAAIAVTTIAFWEKTDY